MKHVNSLRGLNSELLLLHGEVYLLVSTWEQNFTVDSEGGCLSSPG